MTLEDISFKNFDKFERIAFAERLTSVISNFSPLHDESFVLSLNARYGSGKTTFLKMWQTKLEEDGYKVIYINAWETDFDDEPVMPIVGALLDNLDNQNNKKLKGALQGTLGATALIANNIVSQTTGLNLIEMMKDVDTDLKNSDIQALGKELYKNYSYKKKAYLSLKEELKKYIDTINKKPLIILVDELDRVRPNYSVKFLEAIKHIFSLKGICFVLAVDRNQLEASVKQLYGDIDFENYYLRFITREANLPQATKINTRSFIDQLYKKYLENDLSKNFSFPFDNKSIPRLLDLMGTLAQAFRFTPRQTETAFRTFFQIIAISKPNKMAIFIWVEAAMFMCFLFICDKKTYSKIGQGKASPQELIDYLKSLDFNNTRGKGDEREVIITVLSCYMNNNQNLLDKIADSLIVYDGGSLGAEGLKERRDEHIRNLARLTNSFGRIDDVSPFQYIHSLFEQWREFIE